MRDESRSYLPILAIRRFIPDCTLVETPQVQAFNASVPAASKIPLFRAHLPWRSYAGQRDLLCHCEKRAPARSLPSSTGLSRSPISTAPRSPFLILVARQQSFRVRRISPRPHKKGGAVAASSPAALSNVPGAAREPSIQLTTLPQIQNIQRPGPDDDRHPELECDAEDGKPRCQKLHVGALPSRGTFPRTALMTSLFFDLIFGTIWPTVNLQLS
jgi:hypothetical protein